MLLVQWHRGTDRSLEAVRQPAEGFRTSRAPLRSFSGNCRECRASSLGYTVTPRFGTLDPRRQSSAGVSSPRGIPE